MLPSEILSPTDAFIADVGFPIAVACVLLAFIGAILWFGNKALVEITRQLVQINSKFEVVLDRLGIEHHHNKDD